MGKIRIKNLTKIFGKKTKRALNMLKQNKSKEEIFEATGATVGVNNVNLEINENEVFVIMGLSGSGKSTLVRLLNRLIQPTAGEIYIDDVNISKLDKKRLREVRRTKINMVFQNFALFPHRTILKNTEYGLELQGIDKKERRERAEKALENSGLLSFKDQYPDQLSGGMQQRVGIARALANDPEILLMDEAFSALDPLIRHEMQDELIDLQNTVKKTIVFITHDLNEALRIGDRIAIMKDGEIVQIGTGEEILTQPANEYVRDFVEEVDRSKVLTAGNIMVPAIKVNIDNDGPSVILNQMSHEGVDLLLAVNREGKLLGYLNAEDVLETKRTGKRAKSAVNPNVTRVDKDTLVADLFEVGNQSPAPIVVVDGERLLGVIPHGTIIDALAKTSEVKK